MAAVALMVFLGHRLKRLIGPMIMQPRWAEFFTEGNMSIRSTLYMRLCTIVLNCLYIVPYIAPRPYFAACDSERLTALIFYIGLGPGSGEVPVF